MLLCTPKYRSCTSFKGLCSAQQPAKQTHKTYLQMKMSPPQQFTHTPGEKYFRGQELASVATRSLEISSYGNISYNCLSVTRMIVSLVQRETINETPEQTLKRLHTSSCSSSVKPNLLVHIDLASSAAGRTRCLTFKDPSTLSMQEKRDWK